MFEEQDVQPMLEKVKKTSMQSGKSETEIIYFDKHPRLYLKSEQILKTKQKGLIEIIEDDSHDIERTIRRQTFCTFIRMVRRGSWNSATWAQTS